MTITFFGHGSIFFGEGTASILSELIRRQIDPQEKTTFLCGGYGNFDSLCAKVCRNLKKDYPLIEIVYVSPYHPSKMKEVTNLGLYDCSIYPPIEGVHPKFAIIKRNEWMADNADMIFFYVKYKHGGAYKMMTYAVKKAKKYINIADIEQTSGLSH